jgi:hypothetical protein
MALKRPAEKNWVYRQPPHPFMPVPSAGILLGPTASGKTSTAVACILGPFKTVFDAVWIFSPSALLDTAYGPLENHIKTLKGGGLVGEWDLEKLHEIISEQQKATSEEKLRNQKTPLTSTLLLLDDWSDSPENMKSGLITQLFTRNRHY